MRADAEAKRLERRRKPLPDVRTVKIAGNIALEYRWNEIQAFENYQHNLLRRVVSHLSGTQAGANALVRLLRVGDCQPNPYEDLLKASAADAPLHYRVIRLLTSPTWRNLNHAGLWKIQAEAYETWWSPSVDTKGQLSFYNLSPADFQGGAEAALAEAIRLYLKILARQSDPELRSRLAKLRNREDTLQRTWFCVGD